MPINGEMDGTAIVGALVGWGASYFTYRLKLESRLNKLENDFQILEPMKNILLDKGRIYVKKFFEREENI